ncbi:hypothetical protein PCASD_26157 [Puccinia coronata f. sp. avenae]|uniref:Uncharacterized protein n=1 Tax=Puccinia coronata f. sp. avenae TaxID=200324 RepID=A0A2N5S6W5_9BASI|nr:hypothetical protein PCASD_26157 [Puccinia coronata f. sp. avenae]
MLCYPKEAAQVKWASIFFQAVSLVSQDISSLPVYEKPTNSEDEISHNVALIEYLISYVDNPRRSLAISGPSSLETSGPSSTLPKQTNNSMQDSQILLNGITASSTNPNSPTSSPFTTRPKEDHHMLHEGTDNPGDSSLMANNTGD